MEGSINSARASATRCCWPPDSWLGKRSAKAFMSTSDSTSIALAVRSALSTPRIRRLNATLSTTLKCGKSA